MQPLRIQFAAVDAPQTMLDRAIEWLLIALLACCPFAFGAVVAWSEGVFLLLACAIAVCFTIKLLQRPDARFVWSWTYLPIALFLILVGLQLIPLPAGLMRAISPNTAALKTRLLADLLPDAAKRAMTLTFYAQATWRQFRMVAALAAIFVVVLNVFQTVESIRRLLVAITCIALAQAALALAQDVTHSASIYWTIPVYDHLALSGSFVNHSHFGQFMNLGMGAAAGLMFLEWHTRFKSESDPATSQHAEIANFSLVFWISVMTVFACSVALLLSLTRGGAISMLVAGSMTLLVLRLKSPWRRNLVGAISMLVAITGIAVAWIGFERVHQRFASIAETSAANSRSQMLVDLRQAWKQFPVFGTGLGTHGVIFPMFDRSQLAAVATHAENEYAQTMTETGGAGLALAILFAAMIWASYVKAVRGRFSSLSAVAIGLGYGFAAILIHSISDFGQHIPADASMTAVTCGLIVSVARQRSRALSPQAFEEFKGNVRIRIAVAAMIFAACGWVLFEAFRTGIAEREFKLARNIEENLRRHNWIASPQTFAGMIIHAQNASDLRPGNIEYAYWLAVYRWKWISVQSDPSRDSHYMEYARRIADELNSVRLTCPTFGLPASMAGQIETFVLHDSHGASDIRLGSELDRNDPTAVFADGQLAATQGDWDRSLAMLKHYGEIVPGGRVEVIELYVNQFSRGDLALQAAQGDAPALERLADLLSHAAGDPQTIRIARQEAGDLRMKIADANDANVSDLAIASRIAIERGDHSAAIGYLRRELAVDYTQWNLRLDLARELAASGQKPQAIAELHTVLRQNANFVEARQLLNQLEQ